VFPNLFPDRRTAEGKEVVDYTEFIDYLLVTYLLVVTVSGVLYIYRMCCITIAITITITFTITTQAKAPGIECDYLQVEGRNRVLYRLPAQSAAM
jgi:hypothetical protein